MYIYIQTLNRKPWTDEEPGVLVIADPAPSSPPTTAGGRRASVTGGGRIRSPDSSTRAASPEVQIALFNCLDLYHKLPDFGEIQYKSRT